MGRWFNDNVFYEAMVVSEPDKVYDMERKKFTLSRKIRYIDDGQEEWADENQLNEWAIPDGNEVVDSEEDEDGNETEWQWPAEGDNNDGTTETTVTDRCVPVPAVTPSSELLPRSLFPRPRKRDSPNDDDDDDDDKADGRRRSTRAKRKIVPFHATPASDEMNPHPSAPDDGSVPVRNSRKKNAGIVKKTIEEARHALIFKMGTTEEDVDSALEQMEYPYSLNEAIHRIQKEREKIIEDEEESFATETKFKPTIGMRIRTNIGGSTYYGSVTAGPEWKIPEGATKAVKMWEVTYENDNENTVDDMDFNQLLQNRASRSIIRHKNLRKRRPLNALELFSGEGIVTQEFCDLRFNVKSIDVNPRSYASIVLDIFRARYEDLGFVPDFIWASPPCTTYTNLTGGYHRNAAAGQFEKTQEAHDHSQLLASTMYIMRWAKRKNPHLIVVFENPQAQLQKMPMMIEFMRDFGLHKATCHYCAFGRPDKKPTNLWTNVSHSRKKKIINKPSALRLIDSPPNLISFCVVVCFSLRGLCCQDYSLYLRLADFRCTEATCGYHGRTHPIGTKSHGQDYNTAAIPKILAEEVACYVHSKFFTDNIAYTPVATVSPEEEEEFNRCMSFS